MFAPTRLGELYAEAGFHKHESFASAVNHHPLAATMHVGVSRVSIGRYLSGVTMPDLATGRLIVAVLSARLGRPVTLNDAWPSEFAPAVADVALRYEPSLPVAVECVAELLACDIDCERRRPLLGVPVALAALAEAVTGWRYGLADRSAGRAVDAGRVSLDDVARIHEYRTLFTNLDHARGAGLIRAAVSACLHERVVPLLRAGYSDEVGRKLFAAAAQMVALGGWLYYDVAEQGLAQRYYTQALRVARAAGAEARGFDAFVLIRMSQQALSQGHPDRALHLARAARDGQSPADATPRTRALALITEARACARLHELGRSGARTECAAALASAAREFDRGRPDGEPDWISYFDSPEIAAETAHCLVTIGQAPAALEALGEALAGKGTDRARDRLFCQIHEATAKLRAGELDHAVQIAGKLLPLANRLSSARVPVRIKAFAATLPAAEPAAREFRDRVRTELRTAA